MSRIKARGFTIVELLIVIVVIAILAAISIVAYAGIQERASNTAITNAASGTYRAVQAYIAANNSYPGYVSSGNVCVTTDSGCVGESSTVINGSSSFDAAMATIGNLPRSVPNANVDRHGVYFTYNAGLTFETTTSRPMLMIYYLSGTSKNCGIDNIVNYSWPNFTLSTTGFSSNTAGATRCWVTIPGPGV